MLQARTDDIALEASYLIVRREQAVFQILNSYIDATSLTTIILFSVSDYGAFQCHKSWSLHRRCLN